MHGRVFRAKRSSGAVKLIVFAVVIVALIFLIYRALTGISDTQTERQIEISQDAIIKAAVQCYALESSYPTGLQYLEDNYGLTLDREKYIYHYRTTSENLVPEVRVYLK